MRHRLRTTLVLGVAAGLALLLGGCHDSWYHGSYGYGYDRCDSSYLDIGYGSYGGHHGHGHRNYGYSGRHGGYYGGHGHHGGHAHCD